MSSVNWPSGSEVIMSGLTISDMPRIVAEHGFVPIGIDVDPLTLSPSVPELEAAITDRTRAIVIAHLSGGLCDLDPVVEIARRHSLMLIEDCAQAWVGKHQQGDPRCDVSMFSFGPIKTNTALAGGMMEIRDSARLNEMSELQKQWPLQSRFSFFRRVIRYIFLKQLASRFAIRSLYLGARLLGKNHDRYISTAARGFAGKGFFGRIRRQPCSPLLRLMEYKFRTYDPELARSRQNCGNAIAQRLSKRFPVPGMTAIRPTWWVLAILVDEPQTLVEQLWKAGFDATNSSSFRPVGARNLPGAERFLKHLVLLPMDLEMPARELDRMVRIVIDSNARPPIWCPWPVNLFRSTESAFQNGG